MRILIIGGTGFVGKTIARKLQSTNSCEIIIASRRGDSVDSMRSIVLDATDSNALVLAVRDTDVLVNCMTGSADGIRNNAQAIADGLSSVNRRLNLIHMSTMSVYGNQTGVLDEQAPVSDDGNWYCKAKIDAEDCLRKISNHTVSLLRIGCVFGPASKLWVDRIGTLLRAGRLGNLGALGDGWSNLVHVEDIASAVSMLATRHDTGCKTYNLAAPDSPRWNDYFDDFALRCGFTPLRYKSARAMKFESHVVAPPLKIMERAVDRLQLAFQVPDSMPPSLLALWQQQIFLNSDKASLELALPWTPYDDALTSSVAYFTGKHGNG